MLLVVIGTIHSSNGIANFIFVSFFQMFISAFVDVAGHSDKLESAFEILQEAKSDGMQLGIISYSSLMGACSNVCHISLIYKSQS